MWRFATGYVGKVRDMHFYASAEFDIEAFTKALPKTARYIFARAKGWFASSAWI